MGCVLRRRLPRSVDLWRAGTRRGGVKQREHLRGATRIAAPGCNASTVSLSLAPGVAAGVIDPSDIVSVLAVGPSGAGKSLKTNLLGSEILGNRQPNAVGGTHRHIPEIRQALAAASGAGRRRDPDLVHPRAGADVPGDPRHLDRADRRWRDRRADPRRLGEHLRRRDLVHLLPEGRFPRTADVLGANTALIGPRHRSCREPGDRGHRCRQPRQGHSGSSHPIHEHRAGLPEARALSVNGVAP